MAVERTENENMALHDGENDKVRVDYTGASRRSVTPVEGWESGRVRNHNSSVFFHTDVIMYLLPKAAFAFLGSHL